MTFGNQFVTEECYPFIIIHTRSNRLYRIIRQVKRINLSFSMPHTCKIDGLGIVAPDKRIHIRLKCFADKTLLSGFQIHDKQTVQISFVSIALHALPCNVLAIRRVLRIGVIPLVFFGDIIRFLCIQIIHINIRIGRNSIFQPCFLATGISHFVRSRIPCQLLNAAPRFHRTFVWFSFQYIHDIGNTVTVKVCHERMRSSCHPFIPVLIHQVGDNNTRSFRQIRIFIGSAFFGFHLRDEQQFLAVR